MKNIISAFVLAVLFVGNLWTIIGTNIIKTSFERVWVTLPWITSIWISATSWLNMILNDAFSVIFFTRNIYLFVAAFTLFCFWVIYWLIAVIKPRNIIVYSTMSVLLTLLVLWGLSLWLPFLSLGHVASRL